VSTPALPTYDDVLGLAPLIEDVVPPGFIDANGHMNIRHYLDYGATGADVICRQVGIDDRYRAERRMGVFTAEHHIRYFTEMHEGNTFSVHARFLERSGKAGHLLSFILDRDRQAVSCTVEIVLVHVGMDSRRPVEFPADVAAGLDEWIAADRAVSWPAPVCGVMGIRRPEPVGSSRQLRA
jgi:acyl-CoA thioester hydrolase